VVSPSPSGSFDLLPSKIFDLGMLLTILGHCRRRKIRCIPASGDPQSRCSNCIRLKKECLFHPVDQQTETGSSSRRGSQVQGALGGASSSSSPTNGATQASEMPNTLPYPHLSMPPIHDIAGSQMKRTRTDSFSPENKGMRLVVLSLISF
jgi:hypothetical protein